MATFDFSKAIPQVIKHISEGKALSKVDDIIAAYPDGITITDFETGEGKNGEFAVFTFAEDETAYFFGGSALRKIARQWLEMFEGDLSACREALKVAGGVRVKMTRITFKDGKQYIAVQNA